MGRHEHGSHVTNERRVLVHPDKQALGASVAARFITKIIDVLDEQERADIAISGGSVSSLVLAAIGCAPDSSTGPDPLDDGNLNLSLLEGSRDRRTEAVTFRDDGSGIN